MGEPTFDIFSGHNFRDAVWLEVVPGRLAATERMNALATRDPGPYFVYCRRERQILASVDTSKPTLADGRAAR
jgi:hypothetical protein